MDKPQAVHAKSAAMPTAMNSARESRHAWLKHIEGKLRATGLRTTRQRLLLADILFAKGDRHLTAEMLYEEALKARLPISLATIYNTLHHLSAAGLLRKVPVDGAKTYFDTNIRDHYHFFIEDENKILDIASTEISIGKMMTVPAGYEISRVDVVVRLARKANWDSDR